MYAAHVSLAVVGRPWSCMPKRQYGDIVDFINKIRITTILKSLDIKPSKRQVKELTLSLSKLALLTSFVIFKCKDEPEWFEPKLIVE